jgi:hypothetical protein
MQNRLRKLPGERPHRPLRRLRRRLRPVALGLFAALALPASALAASFKIKLHIANHAPVVNKRWPIELTITRGEQKLSGTVRYDWMFDGAVVRTQPLHGSFKFKRGVYRDQLVFPTTSLGEPLTLRFLVTTRYGTEHADWKLQTTR